MLEEKKRYIIPFDDIPGERASMPELPVAERIKHFEEIEKGLSPEQARHEAQRCLSCRRCLGCKLCLAACEKEAIDFDQQDEEHEIEVDEIILTPGVLRNHVPLDERFGYGKFPNVVTDLEFEKILHPSGPYGGVILRPFDGDIPEKIAFVYHEERFFNRHSFIFLLKEAAAAKRKMKDGTIWLLSAQPWEEKEHLKPFLNYLPGLTSKICTILTVSGNEETGNLTVDYLEEGARKEELFEMLILSSTIQLPLSLQIIAEQLGLKLGYRIEPSEDPSPQGTTKEGISVAGGIILSKEGG